MQLVGPMDFLPHELVTVAKAFRLSGTITVFSPLDDGTNQRNRSARFSARRPSLRSITDQGDEAAAKQIVESLRKWRETHSDP